MQKIKLKIEINNAEHFSVYDHEYKDFKFFDFSCVFNEFPNISDVKIIKCFQKYMDCGDHKVSRAEFEKAIFEKRII